MVTKPWENVLNGLTFGIGLVTATAIFNYLVKISGGEGLFELNPTSTSSGPTRYPEGDDYNYSLYAYTEPMRDPPTDVDKLLFGNELYTPGLSYYAYDITESMTQLPSEADKNTIPAIPNPNVQ